MSTNGTVTVVKKPRGFAAMSPEKRSELSRRGGVAAHAAGTAHQFTKEEAREAGRKGGRATHQKRAARIMKDNSNSSEVVCG